MERLKKELEKEIDSLEIEETSSPIQINFYIEFYKDNMKEAIKEIKSLGEELKLFLLIKAKHIGDMKTVNILENAIDKANNEIKEYESIIKENKYKIKNFQNLKLAYIEDYKNGNYYDCNGDITDKKEEAVCFGEVK